MATIMKYYQMSDSNKRNLLSHGSEGRKFGIKVLAGHAPSEGYTKKSVPGPPPSFRLFLLLVAAEPQSSCGIFPVCMCLRV